MYLDFNSAASRYQVCEPFRWKRHTWSSGVRGGMVRSAGPRVTRASDIAHATALTVRKTADDRDRWKLRVQNSLRTGG